MVNELKIPRTIFNQIIVQAKEAIPVEACGLLAGKDNHVAMFFPMTNVDQSCEHFMMKPEEQFDVMRAIRTAKLKMLAIYHSHPNSPAQPSKEDIRMALTPDVIHVIISLRESCQPVMKAFRIADSRVDEITIIINEDKNK